MTTASVSKNLRCAESRHWDTSLFGTPQVCKATTNLQGNSISVLLCRSLRMRGLCEINSHLQPGH